MNDRSVLCLFLSLDMSKLLKHHIFAITHVVYRIHDHIYTILLLYNAEYHAAAQKKQQQLGILYLVFAADPDV